MLVLAKSQGVIQERLTGELAEVEARFAGELASDLSCVNELVTHVERYRGKMLRPTLVLLTAMATDPAGRLSVTDPHRVVATVFEMVHMATLVHDDILDEAEMRRRGATINHLAGNEAAVMLGDYLISHAYHLCSGLARPTVSTAIADATNTVCEGELLQLANRNNWALDEATYFEIIRRKTASLCGTCCRVAAALHEASPDAERALHDYGEKLGIAFQIVDDLLDLTGDEQAVGKTLGRDLEKGKLTLPLIRFLTEAEPAARREALALLADRGEEEGAAPTAGGGLIRDRLLATDAVETARRRAGELIDEAKAGLLTHLPDSPARSLMLEMADAVLTRRF
ncbi:MAG: polyprenyl synthetase family protein [Phycisphaeraceae bacterium]